MFLENPAKSFYKHKSIKLLKRNINIGLREFEILETANGLFRKETDGTKKRHCFVSSVHSVFMILAVYDMSNLTGAFFVDVSIETNPVAIQEYTIWTFKVGHMLNC